MVLITLAELKDHLGITHAQDDTILTSLTTRVSAFFVQATNRRLLESAATVEHYSGDNRRILSLRQTPVTAIESITLSQNRDFAAATATPATEYVIDQEAGFVTRVESSVIVPIQQRGGAFWPWGDYNIEVKYTAGYVTVPEDLKHAALVWSDKAFKRRGLAGLQSESIGSHSVTFGQSKSLPEVDEILTRYRSMPFLGSVRLVS